MNKRQYDREMEAIIVSNRNAGRIPTLLLHSCCAPCSSACIERLSEDFAVTVFYYNPNISPEEEYRKRAAEQRRFLEAFPAKHRISFVEGPYEPERFLSAARGLEAAPEGGPRCEGCFRLRLSAAAEECRSRGLDYVTTTLTVSPLKNADLLNRIGEEAAAEAGVCWLPSDFKKRDGYLRSIRLSEAYGLYRQNYCGCIYSKKVIQ